MAVASPEADYWRGGGLEPIPRSSLFNEDGSLSEIGIEEFVRVNGKLEELASRCGRTRETGEVMADFILWKTNQQMELHSPGHIRRQPMV